MSCLATGSTGKPKGIAVEHCGVANVIAHEISKLEEAGVTAGSKTLNWMALNFDLSVCDFWAPVSMGCAVVVAPAEQLKDVERVAALCRQHSIASTTMVPSMAQVIISRRPKVLQHATRPKPLPTSSIWHPVHVLPATLML